MALRIALMLGDGATAVAIFLFVSFIRFQDGDPLGLWRQIGIDIRFAAVLFAMTWVAALWFNGLYRLRTRWRLWSETRDVVKSSLIISSG